MTTPADTRISDAMTDEDFMDACRKRAGLRDVSATEAYMLLQAEQRLKRALRPRPAADPVDVSYMGSGEHVGSGPPPSRERRAQVPPMTSSSPDTELVERLIRQAFLKNLPPMSSDVEYATTFDALLTALVEALTAQQQEPVGEVEVGRFEPLLNNEDGIPYVEMHASAGGSWVMLPEHQRAVAVRDATIAEREQWAAAWHKECQLVATILGLPEPEAGGVHATAARDRISTLEAQLVEAREALKPFTRRAPVQGFSAGIPWDMHLRAYDVYCKRYSPQKALIEGGCRGGFSTGELDMFIPGWRQEVAEDFRRVRNAALNTGGAG